METRSAKTMLDQINLTDESVGVIFANDGQRLIKIDYFDQLNGKSVKSLCQVLIRPGRTTGECPIPGL